MTFPGTASHNLPRREDWIAKAVAELRRMVKRSNATLSAAVVPTGGVVMYAAGSAPSTGWLLCNGAAVSRTTFSALYSIVGDTYGAGDGLTTFNLPNFTSQFPRGNTPSTGGGASTHTHTLSPAAWAQIQFTTTRIDALKVSQNFTGNSSASYTGASIAAQAETAGVALDGATDSTSSLPPWEGVAFLIKT